MTHKTVEEDEFVSQRGVRDCVIATLATCTGLTYDEVADGLGIPKDSETGKRAVLDGIDAFGVIFPLFQMGWAAIPLIAKEMREGECRPPLPSQQQLRSVLATAGTAVIGYTDPDPDTGPHSLAWDGRRAIDCGLGIEVNLECIGEISSVLVLRRLV